MNEQQDKNAPIQSFKNGAVSIKLWQNQGPEQSFVNVSVRKLYKDEQSNQWKESKNFSPNDLPKLQAILPEAVQAAHSRIHFEFTTRTASPIPATRTRHAAHFTSTTRYAATTSSDGYGSKEGCGDAASE